MKKNTTAAIFIALFALGGATVASAGDLNFNPIADADNLAGDSHRAVSLQAGSAGFNAIADADLLAGDTMWVAGEGTSQGPSFFHPIADADHRGGESCTAAISFDE